MKGEADEGRLQRCVITNETVESLISVRQLDRSGHSVLFGNGKVTITDKDNKVVSEGTLSKISNLYEVDLNQLTAPAPSLPPQDPTPSETYAFVATSDKEEMDIAEVEETEDQEEHMEVEAAEQEEIEDINVTDVEHPDAKGQDTGAKEAKGHALKSDRNRNLVKF